MSEFEVRKDVIYIACQNIIKLVMIKRGKIFRECIKYHQNENISIFQKLIGKKRLTFNQAARKAVKVGFDCDMFMEFPWKWQHNSSIDFAEKLIKACEVDCNDTIKLNKEDAAFVNEWF